jgi:hypothetical protein
VLEEIGESSDDFQDSGRFEVDVSIVVGRCTREGADESDGAAALYPLDGLTFETDEDCEGAAVGKRIRCGGGEVNTEEW